MTNPVVRETVEDLEKEFGPGVIDDLMDRLIQEENNWEAARFFNLRPRDIEYLKENFIDLYRMKKNLPTLRLIRNDDRVLALPLRVSNET